MWLVGCILLWKLDVWVVEEVGGMECGGGFRWCVIVGWGGIDVVLEMLGMLVVGEREGEDV